MSSVSPFDTAQDSWRRQIRFVLVGTQHTGNTGSAARALKTIGFSDLWLVAPSRRPDETAVAMAAGAEDLLQAATIVESLSEALADCSLVIGTTARSRRIGLTEWTPPQAAEAALGQISATPTAKVAVVFGRERTGLTNDELQRCHAGLCIPANPDYSSLNLASAVQIVAYELNRSGAESLTAAPAIAQPATHADWEGFFAQTAEILELIDFHKGRSANSALYKLRRAFLRAPMDQREVRMLRGVLHDMQRALRIKSTDSD